MNKLATSRSEFLVVVAMSLFLVVAILSILSIVTAAIRESGLRSKTSGSRSIPGRAAITATAPSEVALVPTFRHACVSFPSVG